MGFVLAKCLILLIVTSWYVIPWVCMQYFHCLCNNIKSSHLCACNIVISFVMYFIIKCNNLVFYDSSKYFDFSPFFLCVVGLGVNVLHGVAKEGMTWEKDGRRFIYKVETCNASYLTIYLH